MFFRFSQYREAEKFPKSLSAGSFLLDEAVPESCVSSRTVLKAVGRSRASPSPPRGGLRPQVLARKACRPQTLAREHGSAAVTATLQRGSPFLQSPAPCSHPRPRRKGLRPPYSLSGSVRGLLSVLSGDRDFPGSHQSRPQRLEFQQAPQNSDGVYRSPGPRAASTFGDIRYRPPCLSAPVVGLVSTV